MDMNRAIYERYCPSVAKNVVIEEGCDQEGNILAACHNVHECRERKGAQSFKEACDSEFFKFQ